MDRQLREPNIYLFAFHLTHSLSFQIDAADLNLFKGRCQQVLKNFRVYPLPNLQKPANSSIPIKGKICDKNPHNPDNYTLIVTGFVHPLQLKDSYALGLNIGCAPPQPNDKYQAIDASDLQKFNPNNCFSPDFIQSSLGQTLLITILLSEEQRNPHDLKSLADSCAANLLPAANIYFNQSGELFGSPIFEYGDSSDRQTYPHLLVWLFANPETENQFGNNYQEFLTLFFYRNKIIQSYENSRATKLAIAQKYAEIERQIEAIYQIPATSEPLNKSTLADLKTKLKTMPKTALEYAELLRDLEDYHHTIAINHQNYLHNLDRIRNQTRSTPSPNLAFLETFSQQDCALFQDQIRADLGYFVRGSALLEEAIASIRGIVEIEQVESDRNLQTLIACKP